MKTILQGACVMLALFALGCNNNNGTDGGTNTDAGQKTDAGHTDAGQTDAGIAGVMVGTIFAPWDTWTYIPVDGTKCADGSSTGFGINPHEGSKRLNISFEGGGACWNQMTCWGVGLPAPTAANLNGVTNADIAAAGTYDLFTRTGFNNPFANDNFIFIPYCTGDVHTGNNVSTYTFPDAGSADINHVGYVNTTLDLAVVTDTFPTANIDALVVSGVSAGGYGALFNYDRIKTMYSGVPSYLVDDSGPVLRPTVGALAVYQQWDARWHSSANIPAGCTDCVLTGGDSKGWWKIYPFLATDADFRGSLLSSEEDQTISSFYYLASGQIADACGIPGGGCAFQTALTDLNDNVIAPSGPGKMHVFFQDAGYHTYLDGHLHENVSLQNFLSEQLDGGDFTSIVPAPNP